MRRVVQFLLILAVWAAASAAQENSAARSDSDPATIAPGTRINAENWRQYRQFMSEGMQALFEGNRFWQMPRDAVIEVGATAPIPPPRKYLEDTKANSAKVRLKRLETGGYVPEGYLAGIPFPEPLDGDPALRGQRIFWNCHYRYQPRVQGALNYSYSLDRAGNMTQTSEAVVVLSQLGFISDPGFPRTIPEAAGFYAARYSEQIAPEQAKYTAILDLLPTDPTLLDELYEYVPTLRRSLRLSQAARCAPVFGSDYLIDDEADGPPGLPQLFRIEYLGEKKILALVHGASEAFNSPGTPVHLNDAFYHRGSGSTIPFPKPSLGKWELRDVYVISLERMAQFASDYCYGKRVMYIDRENYFGGAQVDLYDSAGELYKTQLIVSCPAPIPGTGGDVAQLIAGPNTSFLINFKDKHVSMTAASHSCVNLDCAKNGYLDVGRYASPEGLLKIVQ